MFFAVLGIFKPVPSPFSRYRTGLGKGGLGGALLCPLSHPMQGGEGEVGWGGLLSAFFFLFLAKKRNKSHHREPNQDERVNKPQLGGESREDGGTPPPQFPADPPHPDAHPVVFFCKCVGLPALTVTLFLSLSHSLSPALILSLCCPGREGGKCSGLVLLAGLEGHLQHTLTQAVAIQAGDGHGCLVVVGHGDEAEALALVGGEIPDDLDIGDCPKRSEKLPQHALISFRGQVVHEDAPASACRASGQAHTCQATHAIDGDWGEPGDERQGTTLGVTRALP